MALNTAGYPLARPVKKIETLITSGLSLFTTQDLATIWGISDETTLYSNIQYYVRTERLHRVHKGIYAINSYTSFELAQKILTPSYISFYSALAAHGLIFQLYEGVHSMALVSKKKTIENETYVYHQLKEEIFINAKGIEDHRNEDHQSYSMAGPERAICDSLYLAPGLAFDSLSGINLELLREISTIYHNQRLESEIQSLLTVIKEKHAQ
ncbi:MAG: hypothetical protein COU69_04080 [Candidatus Pacebacteria bacterium CG10_big_fil_rev_8_21_14_0_10_56_10]|nr:MAG: hypothetical protein COU69_04080 [Candidatus Pacebacteria bacterium CG10_big_fil_rev_8_21_14_0_10_56_10]